MTEKYATQASSFTLTKGRGKGHRILALEFGEITNDDTFDTGLDHIDSVAEMRKEAANATHDLTTASVDKGTITFGVTGGTSGTEIAGAYLIVTGYVKGYTEGV